MFKVFIADDEYYVMSLIMEIVDWGKFNMEVVGTADNGHTALEMMQKLQPDIMIVDVRMPGYDGITLMQKAREMGSNIKFIVISGHRRFDYAKSAMKYNVEDYLLKPVSKEELETILGRLRTQLEQEQARQQEIDQLDNQVGLSKGRMHALLMKELSQGGAELAEMSPRQINDAYLTDFSSGVYRCVIVKLDSSGQDMDRFFLRDLMRTLEDNYLERLRLLCPECVCSREGMRLYLLLQYAPGDESKLLPHLERAVAGCAEQLEKFEALRQTVGVGEAVNSLAAAGHSLQSAELAIDSRFELGCGKLLCSDQVRDDPGIIRVVLSDQRYEQWMQALKSLDTASIRSAIDQLYAIAAQYTDSTTITMHLCREIHRAFHDYMCHINVYKGEYQTLYGALRDALERCQTKTDVKNALTEHIAAFVEQNINAESDNTNPSVRIAIRYVQENYHANLSLAAISSVVNLTPVYFSILFKRETGMTFIDYLNKFRVESAKKMLKDTRYNVNEIADKCGYQDARYFSKIFKKNVGITPSEYRSRQAR